MSFGENILKYLRNNGIRQTYIAERCGWSKQKVYYMLCGKNRISVDDYSRICEALSVPFDFFCAEKTKTTSGS